MFSVYSHLQQYLHVRFCFFWSTETPTYKLKSHQQQQSTVRRPLPAKIEGEENWKREKRKNIREKKKRKGKRNA